LAKWERAKRETAKWERPKRDSATPERVTQEMASGKAAKWQRASRREKARERTPAFGCCAAALLETAKAVWTPSLPVRKHTPHAYHLQPTSSVQRGCHR
jgi:hypothetical protein